MPPSKNITNNNDASEANRNLSPVVDICSKSWELIDKQAVVSDLHKIVTKMKERWRYSESCDTPAPAVSADSSSSSVSELELNTCLANIFYMVDTDRAGLVTVESLVDYLSILVDLPSHDQWKLEELSKLLHPDDVKKLVNMEVWTQASQAWVIRILGSEYRYSLNYEVGVENLSEEQQKPEASSSGTIEAIGGEVSCASREVELDNKVVELRYQVGRLTEDKKELEKQLAESEDFGRNLTCLTTELEGNHRRLSVSLSNSINRGELLLEEAMQVREVEERVAQKVHDLSKELLSKEKDIKKMEELVSTLTEELTMCKDKEEQLQKKLEESRNKHEHLKKDIELKNELVLKEVNAREKLELMLEKSLSDIGALEVRLSEKEEEVRIMSVRGSRDSSHRTSLDDPSIHDVSVDDKVFEENVKAHQSPLCVFTPSKTPIYSPISAIRRRGPSASSTPNSSKGRLDSIADELKESGSFPSFSDLGVSQPKKEVFGAVDKVVECVRRLLIDQLPGQSKKAIVILNKEVTAAKKSIEGTMDDMLSKTQLVEIRETVESLKRRLADSEAMVENLKNSSKKQNKFHVEENEVKILSTRVHTIASLLKSANNSALLAVMDGSATNPNFSMDVAGSDLSNWQLDLEGIQFTEYSAELSKKLIGTSTVRTDASCPSPAATDVDVRRGQVLSASLWQAFYVNLEDMQKESEVSSYLLMMAENITRERSLIQSTSLLGTKPDSTSLLHTKCSPYYNNSQCLGTDSSQVKPGLRKVCDQGVGVNSTSAYQAAGTNHWSQLLSFSFQEVPPSKMITDDNGATVANRSLSPVVDSCSKPSELKDINKQAIVSDLHKIVTKIKERWRYSESCDTPVPADSADPSSSSGLDLELKTCLANIFYMVDTDRVGLVTVESLVDYLSTLVDLRSQDQWKLEELGKMLHPDDVKKLVNMEVWTQASQAWVNKVLGSVNRYCMNSRDGVENLAEEQQKTMNGFEASSSGAIEAIGGVMCYASREVELENKVVELSYQVGRVTEDKKELEKLLAESEDFGLNLTCLNTELEGNHRRLSVSLSNSINKGEMLLEEALQVREVEQRVTQKVNDLSKELLSKEKAIKKMEELVSTLTEELAICKDKEDQLEKNLEESRIKYEHLKKDIELKNELVFKEVNAREKVELMLERSLSDIGALDFKLSEKEEEIRSMSVKGSRGSSQRSSLDDPSIHDVSVDDKVFEENVKAHQSPLCVFAPSKTPIHSPISAIRRRGPSASSTPNSSKGRPDSIADELKESENNDSLPSFRDLGVRKPKKEVFGAVDKMVECVRRLLTDQLPGQSKKAIVILNKEVSAAKKSIEGMIDAMPSKTQLEEMKETIESLKRKLTDSEAMVENLKNSSKKQNKFHVEEHEVKILSARVNTITSLLKSANNSALLAVTQDGSVTNPNYNLDAEGTDLSNWQLDLEGIQFTEYSAEFSKKLMQCSKIGTNRVRTDVSCPFPAASDVDVCRGQVISASLWQTIYVKLEELQKESEVSNYLLMMAENGMRERSSLLGAKPDSTSLLHTNCNPNNNSQCLDADSTLVKPGLCKVGDQGIGDKSGTYQAAATNHWSQFLSFSFQKVRRATEGIPIPGASLLWQSLYTKMEKPRQESESGYNCRPKELSTNTPTAICIETHKTNLDNLLHNIMPQFKFGIDSETTSMPNTSLTTPTEQVVDNAEVVGDNCSEMKGADVEPEWVNLSESQILQTEYNKKVAENKISLLESKICFLKEQLSIAESCVQEKSETCDKLLADVGVAVSERSVLDIRIKYLDAELNTKKSKISELEEKMRIRDKRISQITGALAGKTNEVETLEARCMEADKLINRFGNEIICLKGKLDNCDAGIDELKHDLEIQCKISHQKDEKIVEQRRQIGILKEEIKKALELRYHHQNIEETINRIHEESDTDDVDAVQLNQNDICCRKCEYWEYKLKTYESEREALMLINFELKSRRKDNQSMEPGDKGSKMECEFVEIESDFLLMESILKATEKRLGSKEIGREHY